MEALIAITGKNATLSVFSDRVEYQKFNSPYRVVSHYPSILRVDFRLMTLFDTGFIKVRCPGGNFDFVTHKLEYKEAADCPRALALKKTYNLIQEHLQRARGVVSPSFETSKADELKKLADLLTQGFISQQEFEEQKKKILAS